MNQNEGKGQELTEEQKSELEKLTEEQKIKLNNIGLLFYIVLRDIDEGVKSFKDIILSQLGFHKEGTFMSQPGLKSQLLSILENVSEHSRLVLLMDGFDEISDKDKKIEAVITGVTYQNIHSITTCRPHALGDNVLNVDVEIRLKGFSEAQARLFVEMFARIEYTEPEQIVSFVQQTMNQIKSSLDLTEMSTNPSMLQLLCHLLGWNKGKIGKDKTSLLKDYTRYLVMQYHIKVGKPKSFSDKLYHQNVMDVGKVALMGLKQNKLQLLFSENQVRDICGKTIFDIGFLTELPSTDTDSVKVQFIHKTLQEYLAAYYVVNTPGDEGLQLLMEFCSTSQRLMGSQIILEFVSNMSTSMLGKEIQVKIKDFVSKWKSDDKVDPQRRTSFLLSILEGNKTLKFPLPAVIDIDFRYNSFKKPALERFFNMNGHGVRKINLTLDRNNSLLQNTTINSVDEINIIVSYKNWPSSWFKANSWSKEDNEDLCGVMKKMKPGLLSISDFEWKLLDKATIAVILQNVHTLILEECGLKKEHLSSILKTEHYLKVLNVHQRDVRIDVGVMEAVSNVSSDIKLFISGQMITLKHHSAGVKILSVSKCAYGIHSDDISGNKLTEVDPRLFPGVTLHMPEDKEIDMSEWGITINVDIVKALSKMPKLKSLNASYNKLTPEAAREFSMLQLKQLELYKCGISATLCVPLMISLSKHCPVLEVLNLYGNKLTSDEWCHHVQMKKLRKLYLSNCGICDTVCVSLMISLSKHCRLLEELDLFGNKLKSDDWCNHVQIKLLGELCLYNCGIDDTAFVSLMISLSKHCRVLQVLDLSGNNLSSSGVFKILDHIKHMEYLWKLVLYNNPCMEDIQCKLKLWKALEKTNPRLYVIAEYLQ